MENRHIVIRVEREMYDQYGNEEWDLQSACFQAESDAQFIKIANEVGNVIDRWEDGIKAGVIEWISEVKIVMGDMEQIARRVPGGCWVVKGNEVFWVINQQEVNIRGAEHIASFIISEMVEGMVNNQQ